MVKKGNIGFTILLLTFSIFIYGLYEYKNYMEANNYSVISTSGVSGCADCGFSASLGGFFVGIFSILGFSFAFMILFGIIAIIGLLFVKIGYKLIEEDYGRDTAQNTLSCLFITFVFVSALIIGSLITGEIQAAFDGRI